MYYLFITSFLFCTSCVSTYTALTNIQPGLHKKDVRYILGKPIFIGRSNSLDIWTYKVKKHSQEYTRNIFFDAEHIIKIGKLTPYPNYKHKMINADSLEEYEINASLHQKQTLKRKQNNFRDINTINAKPINPPIP